MLLPPDEGIRSWIQVWPASLDGRAVGVPSTRGTKIPDKTVPHLTGLAHRAITFQDVGTLEKNEALNILVNAF